MNLPRSRQYHGTVDRKCIDMRIAKLTILKLLNGLLGADGEPSLGVQNPGRLEVTDQVIDSRHYPTFDGSAGTPGCPNRIWLHIHHLERFADGGKTSPRNLLGLCSACHKNVHDGLLKIERQTDGSLLFRDQEGRRLDHQVDLEMAYWLDYEIGWTGGEYDSYKARCGVDWAVFAS